MSSHESTINVAIAELLKTTRRLWEIDGVVNAEQNGLIANSAARAYILVIEPGVSPVVVENEFFPKGSTADFETCSRLGKKLAGIELVIQSGVSLVTPERFRNFSGELLRQELRCAHDLQMALYTGTSPEVIERWPEAGYLEGSIDDLSLLVQAATVPPAVVEAAGNILTQAIGAVANQLDSMRKSYPSSIANICNEMQQDDNQQTLAIAATILANAFIFQELLAGKEGGLERIRPLRKVIDKDGGIYNFEIITEWKAILEVNYWPIFSIACRILEEIPTEHSKHLLGSLANAALRLVSNHLVRSHDLTGQIFQKLITDRKFLAAFYTTPPAAALLVGLALDAAKPPNGGKWSNPEDIKNLRIGDFSCGTGTLLSTTYQRMAQLHELAGGDPRKIHSEIMAKVLVGCDILPAAAHLTASMLSMTYPEETYFRSSVLTVPYGRVTENTVAVGSIDFLDETQNLIDYIDLNPKSLDAKGESPSDSWLSVPHGSFDMIIMNPPYTRSTTHEGETENVPRAMFAAFGASDQLQKVMTEKSNSLTHGTSSHGNAGLASIFLVLADRKIRPGGQLALVMPLTFITGVAWQKSRTLILNNYHQHIIVTIAGGGSHDMSFSDDTGMGECLIIAKKHSEESLSESNQSIFVVLNKRPNSNLIGIHAAQIICHEIKNTKIKKLDDGPVGGTPIKFGKDIIGYMLSAHLPKIGGWGLARISDMSLAQTAYQLAEFGNIWLPQMKKQNVFSVLVSKIITIAVIGPYHLDITGNTASGGVRGPFEKIPLKPNQAPSYPMLWAHDAKRERTLKFKPDFQGLPRTGSTDKEKEFIADKVEAIWDTASHCHFNTDFQFNSQSTSMQFTPKLAIGGTAWYSVKLSMVEQEKALVLWSNTSLGLLLYWWHSNKQQSGRGRIPKTALGKLPVLDVTKLSAEQLAAAVKLFDEFCDTPLEPMHRLDEDGNRITLDERFCSEVLGLPSSIFPHLALLREKLACEPSVRGGKGQKVASDSEFDSDDEESEVEEED